MTDEYADSTVAMSAYNAMCRNTGPVDDVSILLGALQAEIHPLLKMAQLKRAVRRAVRTGIIVRQNGRYAPVDRKRRIVVARDRSDAYVDDKGRIRGGWNDWTIKDLVSGLDRLETRPPKYKKEKHEAMI